MEKINLLDCTLRDGGYINDWKFGEKAIENMTRQLESTHVEILELGFLKDEPYQKDRTVFNDMAQVTSLIGNKQPGVQYAVMCEVVNPLPLEKLAPASADTADIIRVIVWKTKHDKDGNVVDALEEGYQYCKGIAEKGYKLCVQPARVDQYSDEEFVSMVRKFSELNPLAIYVVDSWGTQNPENLLHYMHLADENMASSIALGYHGHNNLMQALPAAQAMLREGFDRNIIIDASVYGIGRGAGNLNLEIIAKYMNERCGKDYDISPMLDVNDAYIQDIYKTEQWGYSVPYYLTAKYNCNPNYAPFFTREVSLPSSKLQIVLENMNEDERVIFNKKHAMSAYDRVSKKKLAVGIATNGNWGNVETMLNTSRHGWTYSGANAIVLDYGNTKRAAVAVKNYLLEDCQGISYQKVSADFGTDMGKMIRKFYEENDDAEYLWFMKDCNCINFAELDNVLGKIEKENIPCVLFNPYPAEYDGQKIDEVLSLEKIDFRKYFMRLIACGAMIIRRDLAKKMLELPMENDVGGFWQLWALLSVAAKEPIQVYLSPHSLFTCNWTAKSWCACLEKGDQIELWGVQWNRVLHAIPGPFCKQIESIGSLKKLGMPIYGFYDIFMMRKNGTLNNDVLERFGKNIEYVSPGARKRMKLAVMLPMPLCTFLLKHKDSKVISKIKRLVR